MLDQPFPHRHLVAIGRLSRAEIELVLDTAEEYRAHIASGARRLTTLDGSTVVNLFFENSTRTRMSFEMAAQHLSAYVVNFDVGTSSIKKGESLRDTVETIEAAGANIIVIRHASSGTHEHVATFAKAAVINAGDGWHEHPTQALLDAFTIRRALGKVEGLSVTIVGDVLHSRVARSNVLCLTALGARVTVCGPSMFVPESFGEAYGVRVTNRLDEAIAGADVIYLLRIQAERQQTRRFPSVGEYRKLYGLNTAKLERANPDALVMHPGPVNRGVEISNSIMDRERTVIVDQVAHGVPVRMAVLKLLKSAQDGVAVQSVPEKPASELDDG
ncbi:MAG: aspartate carbamoyltransferase catalytic subunit [Planctomycetota bacterium]